MSSVDHLFESFDLFLDGPPSTLQDLLEEDILLRTIFLCKERHRSTLKAIFMEFDSMIDLNADQRKEEIKKIIIKYSA